LNIISCRISTFVEAFPSYPDSLVSNSKNTRGTCKKPSKHT
jgi:hypothetical protein